MGVGWLSVEGLRGRPLVKGADPIMMVVYDVVAWMDFHAIVF